MSGTLISVGNPHPMWLPQCDPGAVFDDDVFGGGMCFHTDDRSLPARRCIRTHAALSGPFAPVRVPLVCLDPPSEA